MKLVAFIVGSIAALVLFWFFRSGGYYKALFSDEHKANVYQWIKQNINQELVLGDGAHLVTEEGLAIYMTKSEEEGGWILHISISETRGYTTGAAASVFGKLVTSTIDATQHYAYRSGTGSHVRHIRFLNDREKFEITLSQAAAIDSSNSVEHFEFPVDSTA